MIQEMIAEVHPEYSDWMHTHYPIRVQRETVNYDDPIEDLRKDMHRTMAYSSAEDRIVDKILDAVKSGKVNENNFYDAIRKMTARITSDRSIKAWERFSDYVYDHLFR